MMDMKSPIPLESEDVQRAEFAETGEMCKARSSGCTCTRRAGHQGPHVAHGLKVNGVHQPVWAWPGESARPCGCDPGASHVCEACQQKANDAHKTEAVVDGPVIVRGAPRRLTDADRRDASGAESHTPVAKLADTPAPTRATTLPTDPQERKKFPIATGVLFYFPDALAAVARVSFEGNQQHNPGQPLHWARGKSMDQHDTLIRHVMEGGKFDTDGQRHSAKAAWRALAILQLEIEADAAKNSEAA